MQGRGLRLLGRHIDLLSVAFLGVQPVGEGVHFVAQLFDLGPVGAVVHDHHVAMMVMLHGLGLGHRSEPQRENCAESGPAQKRGLARHISDPF